MNQLDKAREKINAIDVQMRELFEQRMKAVEEVAEYKLKNNMKIFDPDREAEVIEKNSIKMQNEKLKPYYREYIQAVMDISKSYQESIVNCDTYGYQGVLGAFSHIATQRLFPHGKMKNYAAFEGAVKGVLNHEIAKAVLPFENSYTGEVGEILDLLFKYDVVIQSIYDLKINQNLLGLKGATLCDIKQVYSKDQAINQCQDFLKNFDYELIPYANTALAAKFVSESQDKSKAAIASIETAELYGLEVLAENINTSKDNTTRFVVVGNELPEDGNHLSIVFTVHHESGQLAKIMQIVAKYGFNMENIKSRSLKDASWQYYFYMEIEGHYRDEKMQSMLEECRNSSSNFKVIGVYNH
ncbi:bifunctional chorismate mutase/prephenate dehydratase [Dielma fastidiosa]|uniref:Bifunctional chorismate mutase/prephenate dehydratase n=1 Tax=Dielma fastidiosa TaxID=1034346 RepID=A0A318KYZ0_9FIRM|nr:bifunctional chorismate mutase/prephenate dehydratase [Dielma fastidiosa]PXX80955.1 chorismate mutase [Dielma fastidiosa]RHN00150.1 bifunctional chorismate mutase/prephenate dehydratase [Dielma fastidiosa]HAH93160.1 bifunctional chorismate mutase/prephenate dehydratase [Dielma fastidiosa]